MHSHSRFNGHIAPGLRAVAAAASLSLVSLLMLGCASTPPPTTELALARAALETANSAGGTEWAPADMRAARDKLTRADAAVASQDMTAAARLAQQAQVDAQVATSKSMAAKARQAAETVLSDSKVLREELDRKARAPTPAAVP